MTAGTATSRVLERQQMRKIASIVDDLLKRGRGGADTVTMPSNPELISHEAHVRVHCRDDIARLLLDELHAAASGDDSLVVQLAATVRDNDVVIGPLGPVRVRVHQVVSGDAMWQIVALSAA